MTEGAPVRGNYQKLTSGWSVTAVSGQVPEGLDVAGVAAAVPGCVHTDLLAAGLIPDPFDGDNEATLQWIGRTVWRYETDFEWHEDGSTRHDLVAEGLDTVATVELNGVVVARTQNQHRSYRIDARDALRDGANHLTVSFAAPVDVIEERVAEYGEWPEVGNAYSYNMLRKSASNFGWDWGIDVATSGIWKPIAIESWSGARIASVRPLVSVDLDGDSDTATGVLNAVVSLERDGVGELADGELTVSVAGVSQSVIVSGGADEASVTVRVENAKLWWPIGYGAQDQYDVEVRLGSSDVAGQSWTGRVGFRTVAIDTTPDEIGAPFLLIVNGERVLVRGANWIPDHAFVTEIDRERYASRIDDAVEANINLLRVWGGGLYESDDFYELASEAGLLVWQDFLFACAAYTEDEWLAGEVEAEAREQITRLSQHASLAIWNGNNENIWGYIEWGWRPELAGRTWGNGYYRTLLPRLVAELDPTRPYSPASPYSYDDYLFPNDPDNGTMHLWEVWNRQDYTTYRDHRPRFASEFGFQGPPAWSTLAGVVHDEPLDPYGHEMLVHQKADQGNLKLERGMRGHLPVPATIEDWHWATQLNQAHALRFGIEYFRSLTPLNTGTIVWQLNDNWPVVSWAAVDFAGQRKPLWYAIRDAYRPRLTTIQPALEGTGLTVVLVNDTAENWSGPIALKRADLAGAVLAEAVIDASVGARDAATIAVPDSLGTAVESSREILVATPVEAFERAIWNFAEVVDQELDPSAAEAGAVAVDGGYEVTVTARSYLRDVALQADRIDVSSRVDTALVTLLAGESASFFVRSSVSVDPAAFVGPLVLRSANDLK
jgi:beta-mannosidase